MTEIYDAPEDDHSTVSQSLRSTIISTVHDTVRYYGSRTKAAYDTTVKPTLSVCTQFILWYMFVHTIYWGLEQVRYSWCVSHGIAGYFHSLITSQSMMCTILTESSRVMSNTQFSNLTMLTSFIGLKLVSFAQSESRTSSTSTTTESVQSPNPKKKRKYECPEGSVPLFPDDSNESESDDSSDSAHSAQQNKKSKRD